MSQEAGSHEMDGNPWPQQAVSQDDIETLREGLRLARTFAAEWGERDAALDRLEARLHAAEGLANPAAGTLRRAEEATAAARTAENRAIARVASLEAELDRLRDELRDWEERTDGFTREATEKEEAK